MPTITRIIQRNILLVALAFIFALGTGFVGAQAFSKNISARIKTQCVTGVTCVDLYDTGAVPYSVSVEVGKSVQFNAKSSGTFHLATAGEEQGSLHADHGHYHKEHISSGDFSGTEAWRVEFKEPGTYQFVDENNPDIAVLVVAYQPGADYSID